MSRKYRAEQSVAINGWDCGTEIELKMVVNFTVHAGSKATEIDPPEEPSVEIDSIRFFDGNDELTLPWSIGDRFISEDGFKSWLLSEAAETEEYARECAAEARAEDARLEGRP